LKSGCKIEDRQFETSERIKPCIALYMIVAWRVLFVTMFGRECPDLPYNDKRGRLSYLCLESEK
ncbi:MAG TPA: IS4 family transposase, partial [Candidatus Brocadiaceae bacterium]|nr:IS4 family transposase [Candidatus Brocadiaceae bacterium]